MRYLHFEEDQDNSSDKYSLFLDLALSLRVDIWMLDYPPVEDEGAPQIIFDDLFLAHSDKLTSDMDLENHTKNVGQSLTKNTKTC